MNEENEKYFIEINLEGELLDEAKNFLKRLPKTYGEFISDAIRKAMETNTHKLNMVRAMRAIKVERNENLNFFDEKIQSDNCEIDARIYTPKNCEKNKLPTILYLHGGGWVLGGIDNCSKFCQSLAAKAEAVVVAIEYRLAPETKYPMSIIDSNAAYDWIEKNIEKFCGDKNKIFVAGDSAGGHLCAALIQTRIQKNQTLPLGTILFYPVTTFENRSTDESWRKFGKGYALDSLLMETFNDAYISIDKRKAASPLNFNELENFPPTLILTSGCDILNNQGVEFARKLRHCGVQTRHINTAGATHIYITMEGMPQCFQSAVNESTEFIKKIITDKK